MRLGPPGVTWEWRSSRNGRRPCVCFEQGAHRPVGVVKPRAGRPGRDVEHLADLVQAKSEVVVKHENRPLLGREPPEPSLDLIVIRERSELIRSSRPVHRQGPNGGDPGALAARLAVAGVDERPLEPGIEPVRITEAGQVAPGDHHRLLHRVLGQADDTENAARDLEEPRPRAWGQDGERLPVPTLGLLDEVAIHSLRPQSGAHRVRRPSLHLAGSSCRRTRGRRPELVFERRPPVHRPDIHRRQKRLEKALGPSVPERARVVLSPPDRDDGHAVLVRR